MEADILAGLVATAANVERLGIIGILALIVIYREYKDNKEKKAIQEKTTQILERLNTNFETNEKLNSAMFEWIKENNIGVKKRLDDLNEKLDINKKEIISEMTKR